MCHKWFVLEQAGLPAPPTLISWVGRADHEVPCFPLSLQLVPLTCYFFGPEDEERRGAGWR